MGFYSIRPHKAEKDREERTKPSFTGMTVFPSKNVRLREITDGGQLGDILLATTQNRRVVQHTS